MWGIGAEASIINKYIHIYIYIVDSYILYIYI